MAADGQTPDSQGVDGPPPWAAKVENFRSNFLELHFGQAGLALLEAASTSNSSPQPSQRYS